MNRVWFTGNIGKTPEIRTTQSGVMMASFSLAVRRRFKKDGETDTDWFSCVAFNKQAEFVDKYLKQGSKIGVVGRIENDNYTNKDGQKVYGMKVMVEEIEFAESKNAESKPDKPAEDNGEGGWMNVADGIQEELPFL